jgi:hypothetical protein
LSREHNFYEYTGTGPERHQRRIEFIE